MYIANLTIETKAGIFATGEKVEGLTSSDIEWMTAEGYITVKAEKKEAAEPEQSDPESSEKEEEPKKKKRGTK